MLVIGVLGVIVASQSNTVVTLSNASNVNNEWIYINLHNVTSVDRVAGERTRRVPVQRQASAFLKLPCEQYTLTDRSVVNE